MITSLDIRDNHITALDIRDPPHHYPRYATLYITASDILDPLYL